MRPTIPKTNFCREIPSDPRPQGKRINSKPNKYQPCVVACPYTS